MSRRNCEMEVALRLYQQAGFGGRDWLWNAVQFTGDSDDQVSIWEVD